MSGLVAVSGYTSIDTRLVSSSLPRVGETALLEGDPAPAARFGGCAPIVARWLRRLAVPTALIAWLGEDDQGRAYRALLAEAGVDLRWLEVGAGATPRSWLVSDPAGNSICLFHPSGSHSHEPPDLQAAVAEADWLALTVGPEPLTRALLEASLLAAVRPRLAWDVKADRLAFPADLVQALARADLVCLNHSEAAFVGEALGLEREATADDLLERGAATVAITRGRAGATVAWDGGHEELQGEALPAREPTGAGDAFFAGLLAALRDGADPAAAGRRGLGTAAQHLMGVMSE
jgi:ribokinase